MHAVLLSSISPFEVSCLAIVLAIACSENPSTISQSIFSFVKSAFFNIQAAGILASQTPPPRPRPHIYSGWNFEIFF